MAVWEEQTAPSPRPYLMPGRREAPSLLSSKVDEKLPRQDHGQILQSLCAAVSVSKSLVWRGIRNAACYYVNS